MSAALKNARRDRGLTLTELGDALKVSASLLARYERGETVPAPSRAKSIAEYFGVRQSEFWPAEQSSPTREAA